MDMTDSKPRSTRGSVARHLHLLLTAFSVAVALLLSYDKADAQTAGSQTAKLIGTIESNGFVGAVLSDAKGEQVFYRLKEKLPDGSKIVEVRSDSISLKSADGIFYNMYIAHDTRTVATVRPEVQANPPVPAPASNAPAEQPALRRRYRWHVPNDSE